MHAVNPLSQKYPEYVSLDLQQSVMQGSNVHVAPNTAFLMPTPNFLYTLCISSLQNDMQHLQAFLYNSLYEYVYNLATKAQLCSATN